jgi:hypothetical protein
MASASPPADWISSTSLDNSSSERAIRTTFAPICAALRAAAAPSPRDAPVMMIVLWLIFVLRIHPHPLCEKKQDSREEDKNGDPHI